MKKHCNSHKTNKKHPYISKSQLPYSTRIADNMIPNIDTIKKYQLNYNYETPESFNSAVLRNTIDYPESELLQEEKFTHKPQTKENPLLCSSDKSEPLFIIDETETIQQYPFQKSIEKMQRYTRYVEYFKRHYGTL